LSRTSLKCGHQADKIEDKAIKHDANHGLFEVSESIGPPFDERVHLRDDATISPVSRTGHGAIFGEDCNVFLRSIRDETVDTVFADPPFNLKKIYGARSNDDLTTEEYLTWCRSWIEEAARTLKPGGAFFLYNIPRWNILLGSHMTEIGLEFRHWIAVNLKLGLPIAKKLYPAHYSLLYFTKGKPKTFRKIRTPIQKCRHCGGEVKDYGGHRNAMNPKGVNLSDVWDDIPPVRHSKYKSGDRKANALSSKLLDRVIEISTEPGDLVIDPFGGSGTTFAVCEAKHRRWMGTDIDFSAVIAERVHGDLFLHRNGDYIDLD